MIKKNNNQMEQYQPCTQALRKGSWEGLNFWQLVHKGTREGSTFLRFSPPHDPLGSAWARGSNNTAWRRKPCAISETQRTVIKILDSVHSWLLERVKNKSNN